MPRSSQNRTTPSQAANPNADPPDRTTASSLATSLSGESSSHSRVAGAPPRTSPDATVPSGKSTTVHPVDATSSVQWPTRTPGISVIDMDARHARADPGHDLVGDRAHPLRPLVGGDALAPLRTDQHDLVTTGHGVRSAIDHQLIHGDGPGDWPAAPADERFGAGLREGAGDAV